VRDALSGVLATNAAAVINAWRREVARPGTDPYPPLRQDILPMAFDAYLALLRHGSMGPLADLIDHALADSATTRTPAEVASQLHRMLGALALAALPTVLDCADSTAGWQEHCDEVTLLVAART
jgi:hypothetical protein